MKRLFAAGLIAALGVALLSGAAQAEEALELDASEAAGDLILSDETAIVDGGQDLDLDLDLDLLELAEPQPLDAPEILPEDASEGDPTVSNKSVFKKLIRYEIKNGKATVVYADRAICEAKIPRKIKNYEVTAIADGAFAGCKDLWTVTVPDTVTEIGAEAFADCGKLVFVTLPVGLQKIGNYAFKNCTMISHFELPEGLTEISEGMFENCEIMWKIALPATLQRIGDGAFCNCKKLKQFTLPAGLAQIGVSAFEGCQDMREISIPGGVETIPDFAFKNCSELNIVKLSEGLRAVGQGAFQNCASMRSIKLPSTVESIGRYAFAYCEEMTKLYVPAQVASLGYGAFFHCGDAEEICVYSGVTEIGDYCFAQCKSLVSAAIADTVTSIGENAFAVGSSAGIDEYGAVQLGDSPALPKKLKMYGKGKSYAAAYAKAKGIPFVARKVQATNVRITQGKSLTLYVGQTVQLTAVQEPADAETDFKWKSNSSSVSVSSTGLLTPKRSGEATVTVRTENDKKATITVKVVDAKSVSIVEGKTVTMKVGETLQLTAAVMPEQVTTKLTWSSGSKRTATVSKTGLVKAKKKGSATITVKTANGKRAKIKIKVTG